MDECVLKKDVRANELVLMKCSKAPHFVIGKFQKKKYERRYYKQMLQRFGLK